MKRKNPMEDLSTLRVSAPVLAAFLGVTAPTIRDFAAKGIVKREGRAEYALMESVRLAFEHMRTQAAKHPNAPKLLDARTRRAVAEAERMEMKLAQERGELIILAEAEAVWGRVVRTLRNGVLALPTRLRALLHLTAAQQELIDREVRDLLTELSRTPPIRSKVNEEKQDA